MIDLEIAALLIEVFRPRRERYAWRIDDTSSAERLTAWEHERLGARARVWRVGDWRPAGQRLSRRPVTVEDIALHVAGARTLGFYPMHADGSCCSVSADFDDHRGERVIERDPREDFAALVDVLRGEGVAHLAHHSRGGRGYWVHVLPPSGVSAREARAVLHGLLRAAGVRPVAEGGTFDGLFPKQDEADVRGGPGNLFCLPLSRRWLANDPPGSGFVGVDPRDFEAQVYHLWKARRVARDRWSSLVARFEHPTPSAPPRRARAAHEPTRASGVVPSVSSPSLSGPSAWELALRRARRLGRPLGDGRHALLCINDAQHSTPDRSAEGARGSCVLFAPSPQHPQGFPWCAHAHCARLTERDWIDAVGRDAWDDACLSLRGMRRAGPWLLHPGGVSGWFRDASGAITPSRRERLCEVPVWIVEELCVRGRAVRVIEAVVDGRVRRARVLSSRFAGLAWLRRFGVDADCMLPQVRARLVEALERLSEPVPARGEDPPQASDQVAAQARADDLLSLLRVVRAAATIAPSNDTAPRAARAR